MANYTLVTNINPNPNHQPGSKRLFLRNLAFLFGKKLTIETIPEQLRTGVYSMQETISVLPDDLAVTEQADALSIIERSDDLSSVGYADDLSVSVADV